MSRAQTLSRLVQKLEAAHVPYMAVGSLASGVHGEFRTSYDLDIVIDPDPKGFTGFLDALGEDYFVDATAAHDALRRRDMFNIIDRVTMWKIDLILLKDRPFSHLEFRRRMTVEHEGLRVPVATAEDTILSKLEWNKISPSERQVRDVMGVVAAHRALLDRAYMARWALSLGVAAQLDELLREADRIARS